MSTAVTAPNSKPAATVSATDTVRAALERMKGEMALALPKHITPERMLRVAMTAIRNTPKLLECERTSLYAAVMMCAQLGLEPDGVLGQAYLIPYGNKVQFIPGYKGLISLARNSGDVISISAHEVCDNDHFDFCFGLNEKLEHRPARGERGAIIYFYAIARFKDGGYHFDVITKEDVDKIRAASPGRNTDPWKVHYAEMGKKTAIRRIAKYLPMSVQRAAAVNDAYDSGRFSTLDKDGDLIISSAPEQIENKTVINPETGEVTEPEVLEQEKQATQTSHDPLEQFEAE